VMLLPPLHREFRARSTAQALNFLVRCPAGYGMCVRDCVAFIRSWLPLYLVWFVFIYLGPGTRFLAYGFSFWLFGNSCAF
jgi:hypothetical protein